MIKISRFARVFILATAVLWIINMIVPAQPPIRILPLGNSITYDENSLDKTNPRPVGDRISYRYKLFQLLYATGWNFDYVGSENSGYNYFLHSEYDDNAGFPGIETWQLTHLINTGYNYKTGIQESTGPYLNSYPADIILLHIGTNNLIESPSDVKALLDTIRSFNSYAHILVARIINRQTYHPSTTVFNNNVEAMLLSRGDPRIRMVNMETGANINYSTDMVDNLHPNPAGFDKMAYQWFEAIDDLNQAPETSFIPEQLSSEGTAFPGLILDDFVSDIEDPDELLSWTFSQQPGSHLQVSIDQNRILHAVPLEGWHESETIKLRVEDSGNGAFPKTDSAEVLFTINDPPVITSSPPVSDIHVEEEYQYMMTAMDVDEEDLLTFTPITVPGWLSIDPEVDTLILRGIASWDDIGSNSIVIMVSDGHYEVFQEFTVEVHYPTDILVDHIPVRRIYPNPADHEVIIHTGSDGIYTIEIASLKGQLLRSTEMKGMSCRLDLSFLQKGTYFITVRSKDHVTTEKIIKLN